ncbi:MAG: dinitrogenase iron-molybdenum cofactor biosynthesis protein [Trichlorobacter sp.]|uniref:NifB/NifX family molybdenum-iron cluster-binding protein n=1 Tax=Trichlorobacter sp. TaxID=2911007 RepID=UPI0025679880|nr:NifB/NifX family molybdenum-iron cluster-binding protein [Trichlorobacter sp.]MDK9718189.1 dinitrogenase iron-molybdenum cofactor biosynthesis protein [Trichlorobacter sp.]
MLIAVTSSDGKHIDTHFGKADRFLVYEVSTGEPALLYEVQVPRYCDGAGPGHDLMADKLAAITTGLGACRVVVTAMIGESPKEEMERLGVDIISLNGPVADVLKEVIKLY